MCADAIESTDRAANYINEMQRVSEMYSSLFDDLLRESGMADVGLHFCCSAHNTKLPLGACSMACV